jgi:regulator of sigma E protease
LIPKILASDPIVSLLAIIVVLGILITVHEFGHFAVAKLLKIRVLTFSLGFGPRLIGFKRGGTDYRLSYFPLGGYVKMAGEAPDEERKGDSDEFLSHPKWHRFLVAISGPLMNILLAVVISTSFYIHGVNIPEFSMENAPPIVGPVTADPAKRAGLQSGDLIVSVHNNQVYTWEDLEYALATAPIDALDIEVQRNNKNIPLHFDAPATERNEEPFYGFRHTLPRTRVNAVSDNTPAQRAGLKAGDEILSVRGNGRTGTNYDQILNIISDSKGIPLDFEIHRPDIEPTKENLLRSFESQSGKIIHLTIAPFEDKNRQVIIGFNPAEPYKFLQFRPIDAFTQSIQSSYKQSAWLFKIIGRFFKGAASVRRTLSGPIGIAKKSGEVARTRSIPEYLGWLGFISLQLGIFNLLPIPLLDGGVIMLLFIEGLLRRDLSLKLKEKILQAGFVFLVLLMGFIIFNDLAKNIDFGHLFHR